MGSQKLLGRSVRSTQPFMSGFRLFHGYLYPEKPELGYRPRSPHDIPWIYVEHHTGYIITYSNRDDEYVCNTHSIGLAYQALAPMRILGFPIDEKNGASLDIDTGEWVIYFPKENIVHAYQPIEFENKFRYVRFV